MSFLGKASFCANGHSQLQRLCHVIQSDLLTVNHPPTICFLLFTFPVQLFVNWNGNLICNRAQFLCNFHFLKWLLLLMPCPFIGSFIFRDLVCHYQLVDPGHILCCRAHIALWDLQAIAMMVHRIAFCLSGKVVVLPLDNSTAKAYLCNQGGTVSPFLSRLACRILSLTNKEGITLIPAYIPTHFNVEADYLSQLFTFGVYQRWICWHLPVPPNARIITSWKLHYLWGPWG